ncbi:regulator of chromosome condensation 1/beta-lactamase-inhibitor protein II [Paraphoma chrysanthemicola]|nr:regulator of chromosome condensation 1/beta-lactamase-inhibitor protein II [Paraphoma chrysanthemicola]
MARAVPSRAAAAKPTESKDAKVNGNGPARRAKTKAQEVAVANGVDSEPESDTEPAPKPAAKKRKVNASSGKQVIRADQPAVAARPAKNTPIPVPEPKSAAVKTKRKKDDVSEDETTPEPEAKKAKVAQPKAAPKAVKKSVTPAVQAPPAAKKVEPKGPRRVRGQKTEINPVRYTEPLKVFVFGEGANGELGLGADRKAIDVKRPRYNPILSDKHEVVRVATGGMHVLALTKDNKILSWGVNDSKALGRKTDDANVKMRDLDADDDSDSEDETGGLIDLEATPTAISDEHFPPETVFVDIAAGDSCSFALTTEGAIYGWGTFRKNEGILGFAPGVTTADYPQYVEGVTKATQIVCGTNHIFALTKDGNVFAWGNGQQNQLGRRLTERNLSEGLFPSKLGFRDLTFKRPSHKFVYIASGDYHGLAIAQDGRVWAWGVNNYCETGYPANAGADDANVIAPRIVASLEGKQVEKIAAGSHHNIVLSKDGQALVWGRCDGSQTGLTTAYLAGINDEEKLLMNNGKPKILIEPTPLPGLKNIVEAACGPDHSIVIDQNGKAYSWGFSANYQTGQGTDDDIDVPTMIDNTAVRDIKLNWVGCGGQYSVLTSLK